MPDMDGLTAVKEILNAARTPKLSWSRHGPAVDGDEAIKQGAKDFVVKPFEKSRVLQAIKNVTEN